MLTPQADALAIHSAVLSMPGPDKAKLVQYLIQSFPEHLDSKSIRGYTPLHLAFRIHHPRLAKLLIDSGADQTCRDVSGNNLVHTVLWPEQGIAHQNLTRTRELLDLVDPRLRPSLFTERCSEDPGSLTPLHRWIINATPYGHDSKELADLLGLTLEYSKGVELDTINGAGDTPLHTIVSQKNTRFLNVIMEYRADLLHRENAIGRTPADVRFDKDNAMKLSDPPTLGNKHRRNLVDQNPDEFLQKDAEREEWADWGEAWAKALGRGSKKRKLVSLFEANEVARRLTAREASKKRRMEYGVVVEEDEQSEHVVDELQNWYGKYVGWDEVEPQAVS